MTPGLETFERVGSSIVRRVVRRSGRITCSSLEGTSRGSAGDDLAMRHDSGWLRRSRWPALSPSSSELRVADLFSGCGGLSLGTWEACRALALTPRFVLSCDSYRPASDVHARNFGTARVLTDPLESYVDGVLFARSTASERALVRDVGQLDLVVTGPPCQGHSDLNNHTRRRDPKNRLVLTVARFAEIFEPSYVLIENVQGIRHDQLGALSTVRRHLDGMGYEVTEAMVSADSLGVPQERRRFFLFASRVGVRPLADVTNAIVRRPTTVRWATEDLIRAPASASVFNTPSTPTAINRSRIDYLFKRQLFDLPNERRPPCHRDGNHSYKAVYGRLHWDVPAPTITTGFGCMGQGRFVHPEEHRTLTPHEAARLQTFPDFFDFGERKRGEYQQLIGNAVPPLLAYAVLLHQLA